MTSVTKCLKVISGVVGGHQDFSVRPSPLGTNWVFELIEIWLGLGLGFFPILVVEV